MQHMEPHIRYCTTEGGLRVAYAMVGQGPGLLVPPGWIGHLELLWQDPLVRAFYLPLARHRTVVRWDRPGCGLSDPSPDPPSLEEDLEVLEAVADQLGLDCFDLLGISMGAPTSIAFATRHPDRVGRLVVYGGFANGQELGPGEARTAMMDLMVRGEAVIVGLFGTLGGLGLGLFLGWALVSALASEGFGSFAVPTLSLAVVLALGALAGVLAAARPARRAARMNVLSAIATE
jgi:pimeloyl-ACP methyl ester carboxylesterase